MVKDADDPEHRAFLRGSMRLDIPINHIEKDGRGYLIYGEENDGDKLHDAVFVPNQDERSIIHIVNFGWSQGMLKIEISETKAKQLEKKFEEMIDDGE